MSPLESPCAVAAACAAACASACASDAGAVLPSPFPAAAVADASEIRAAAPFPFTPKYGAVERRSGAGRMGCGGAGCGAPDAAAEAASDVAPPPALQTLSPPGSLSWGRMGGGTRMGGAGVIADCFPWPKCTLLSDFAAPTALPSSRASCSAVRDPPPASTATDAGPALPYTLGGATGAGVTGGGCGVMTVSGGETPELSNRGALVLTTPTAIAGGGGGRPFCTDSSSKPAMHVGGGAG